jgi:hypothetical protein
MFFGFVVALGLGLVFLIVVTKQMVSALVNGESRSAETAAE